MTLRERVEELLDDLPGHPLQGLMNELLEVHPKDTPELAKVRWEIDMAFRTLTANVHTNYLLAMLILELRDIKSRL